MIDSFFLSLFINQNEIFLAYEHRIYIPSSNVIEQIEWNAIELNI
jgi:hypothetical protein